MSNGTVLEKIHNAGLKFLVPLNLQETYKLIVQEAMKLVHAEMGSVYIYEKGELQKVYASNPLLYQIKPRKKGITYSVFRSRKPEILTSDSIQKIHPEFRDTLARSDIIVPLAYKNKSVGVLTVMSKKNNFFSRKDLEVLKLFSPMASLAIKKNQLYEEAKLALESRDLFISMASHELRTPLTAINGYSQLLFSKLGGSNNNSKEAQWSEQLYYECVRLNLLINDLLEINKIRTGEFLYNFKECKVEEILQRAINNISFMYPQRKISFDDRNKEKDTYIIADFDKILQATVGILDNAFKFSDPDTGVFLELDSDKKNAIIKIQDFGVGVETQDLPHIFDNYFIGKNHSREGMGLGLFLAHNIIKRHHGLINLTSKRNKGTKVVIKLPLLNSR